MFPESDGDVEVFNEGGQMVIIKRNLFNVCDSCIQKIDIQKIGTIIKNIQKIVNHQQPLKKFKNWTAGRLHEIFLWSGWLLFMVIKN